MNFLAELTETSQSISCDMKTRKIIYKIIYQKQDLKGRWKIVPERIPQLRDGPLYNTHEKSFFFFNSFNSTEKSPELNLREYNTMIRLRTWTITNNLEKTERFERKILRTRQPERTGIRILTHGGKWPWKNCNQKLVNQSIYDMKPKRLRWGKKLEEIHQETFTQLLNQV